MTPLTASQQAALDKTIREAEQACRAEISVFVGEAEGDPRQFSTSLHNTLVLPARSVLVMVDPSRKVVEVVTGGQVRERVSDADAARAVSAMTDRFATGDLAGGLAAGIKQLAGA